MPIILSIETSTKACSAAIHHDGKLLSASELYNEKSSSGMLTTLIEHVVKTASLKLQDIDAVAVAKGEALILDSELAFLRQKVCASHLKNL